MLQFQLDTPSDLKEAAIIAKRRRFEEERKERIFNARNRIIGVDVHGLKHQIDEKAQIKRNEEEKERRFREEAVQRDQILLQRENEIRAERRRVEKDMNEYRLYYQKKEDRREYDINDPNYVTKSQPTRTSDTDRCLGVSSAQQFLGEDLLIWERKRAQNEQQKAWLLQQMEEKRQAEENLRQADRLLSEALNARDRRALELEEANKEYRRKIDEATLDYNTRLAEEQSHNRMKKQQEEMEDNLAEQYNNMTSDMLRETKNYSSNFGPNHMVVTDFRGMTDDDIKLIRDEQVRNLEDLQKRRFAQEMETRRWEEVTNSLARKMTLSEREMERNQRSLNVDVSEENLELAEMQKRNKDYIDKKLYTNRPTQAYFDQFNTTTR